MDPDERELREVAGVACRAGYGPGRGSLPLRHNTDTSTSILRDQPTEMVTFEDHPGQET